MASSGEFELRDDERLPWLETVDEDYAEGPSILRTLLFVLLGLAIIAAIVYGVFWFEQRHGQAGNGQLIAAQEGDYKVKPDDPGGMKVEGAGDTAFATSEGKTDGNAQIDLKALPEAPVTAPNRADAPGAPAKPADAPAPQGALVQLGSFPDAATANEEWSAKAKRFGYLAALGKSIEPANVNGRTYYRLRVNAGSADAASELCAKLKVAGEACFIP
jgi:hypothetical protein